MSTYSDAERESSKAATVQVAGRKVRVAAEIPEEAVAEFESMMLELFAGQRNRALALEQERAVIQAQAVVALERIVTAIRAHPGTGRRGVWYNSSLVCIVGLTIRSICRT